MFIVEIQKAQIREKRKLKSSVVVLLGGEHWAPAAYLCMPIFPRAHIRASQSGRLAECKRFLSRFA